MPAQRSIGVWALTRRVGATANARNISLISAGVAFYAMLSIFPAVAAIIALWGFISDAALVESQLELLRSFVPQDAFELLSAQVHALVGANDSTLGWATILSTLVALWTTRAGVAALINGLNAVYGTEARSGLWNFIAAILLTLVLVLIALTALACVVIVPIILAFMPLGDFTAQILFLSRWGLVITVVLLGLSLLYHYGPNHAARTGWVSAGAVFALVLWALASVGFSFYLSNFGNYNEVYGSIGAVIALLMWFFISAYVVLLGGVLNAELSRRD